MPRKIIALGHGKCNSNAWTEIIKKSSSDKLIIGVDYGYKEDKTVITERKKETNNV